MHNTQLHQSTLRRRWLWIAGSLVAACLLYALGTGWWNEHLVQQELTRLHSIGIPTSAQELNAFYAIPLGKADATSAWLKPINAFNSGILRGRTLKLPILDKTGQWPPLPGNDWPDVEVAKQLLVDHLQLLQDIDAAVATPGQCCFIKDFSPGGNLLLPHTQSARMIVRLLALRAFIHAHQDDADSSLNDIDAMLTSADILANEPVKVSQLCRNANLRLTLLTLEQLLPFFAKNEVSLAEIQERIAAVNFRNSLKLQVLGDRVLGLTSFEDPKTAGAGQTPSFLYRAWVRDHPRYLLETMRDLDRVIAQDWPAPLEVAIPYNENQWKDAQAKSPWGNQEWHSPTKFANTITSSIIEAANDEARAQAAVAAIAAAHFNQLQGHWPKSLDELVPNFLPSVPLDPFTQDEPLKFIHDEDEIRIYSVGQNFEDDNGLEPIEVQKHGRYRTGKPDVVFTIRLEPSAP